MVGTTPENWHNGLRITPGKDPKDSQYDLRLAPGKYTEKWHNGAQNYYRLESED